MSLETLSELQLALANADTPEELARLESLLYSFNEDEEEFEDGGDLAEGIAHGQDMLARQNVKTALTQEIGPLPAIKDPARRAACERDLLKFTRTYYAKTIYLGLAEYQIEMINAFQDSILNGGRKARAVRRGGFKSTLARIAIIWAILNGHLKFPILAGATDDKSNEHRDNTFAMMQTSQTLIEDFPEIIPLLLKHKNPKKQLRLDGKILEVHAKNDRGLIVFPANESPSSEAHIAPYSIASTDVSGLSFVHRSGEIIRPDFILFDDVQTPQSAQSAPQTSRIENMITTTFMGLAALPKIMPAVMVCTVREIDDLTNRFCDRERHPDWDGQKFPTLISLPTRLDLWKEYESKLRDGDTPEDGFALANEYYQARRVEMDEGSKVAWQNDRPEKFASALEWCMYERSVNPAFFSCELQQEGTKPQQTLPQLEAKELIKRISGTPRGIVPDASTYLTAFVDSQDQSLWWVVCAWSADFTGWIVDYGTFPDQRRATYYKADLSYTISDALPDRSWEEQFAHAHNMLDKFLAQEWRTETNKPRQLDLLLKDWGDGDHRRILKSQVAMSPLRSIIRPSRGNAPKPGRKPVHFWGDPKRDRQTESHWVEVRSEIPIHVQFDSNRFKSLVARRLLTTMGSPSCIYLPGSDERANELLVGHLTSEQRVNVARENVRGEAWEQMPGRDNEFFDGIVGNAVAASMLGAVIPGEEVPIQKKRKRYSQDEINQLIRSHGNG